MYRRAELDRELAQLRAERSELGLAGPIVMTAVGGGILLVSGSLALMFMAASHQCETDSIDSDILCGDHEDEAKIFGVIALGGAVLGIVGVINLGDRIGERRENSARIKDVESERDSLGYRLGYDVHLRPGHASAELRLAF